MQKTILHACCAVCSAYPVEKLKSMGYEPIVYFFNPNIAPNEEYERRRDELVKYCEKIGVELVVEDGSHENWLEFISGLENEPEKGKRCEKCFEYRLLQAVRKAKELGISNFTTTLTVSPHKNSQIIFKIAEKIAADERMCFIAENFKKQNGFLRTMELAKENDFYRQNYCGCEFSIRN